MGFTDFVNDQAFSGKLWYHQNNNAAPLINHIQPSTPGCELEVISLGMSEPCLLFLLSLHLMRNNWSVFKRRLKTPLNDYFQCIECTSDSVTNPMRRTATARDTLHGMDCRLTVS